MSWLRKPGSRVLHIRDQFVLGSHIEAKCPARFPEPWNVAYHVSERVEGERVCVHCARIARREALVLLAKADGLALTDPTVRRRGVTQ